MISLFVSIDNYLNSKFKNMVVRVLFSFLLFFSSLVSSQIAVSNWPPFDTAENIVDDLLLGDVGQRHKGPLLSLVKVLFPRKICIFLDKLIPIGLFLLITATK